MIIAVSLVFASAVGLIAVVSKETIASLERAIDINELEQDHMACDIW